MEWTSILGLIKGLNWKLILIAAWTVMVMGATWKVQEWRYASKNTAILEHQLTIQTKQDKISDKASTDDTAAVEKIQIVYRDREIFYDKISSNCPVPNGFVSMWNSANRAFVPDATTVADATPSGIKLATVAKQHDIESKICQVNTQRLKDLQKWVNDQHQLNGE